MTSLRNKIADALAQYAVQSNPHSLSIGIDVVHEAADAVLAVLDLDQIRAESVRESTRYIERITPKGLVDRADVLADLEIAAGRLAQGFHANGRDREEKSDE